MRDDRITPEHQQMDLSNDPEEARRLRGAAPELAMASRRQRFAGSAVGIGSIGFDEEGAFDVGAGRDPHDDPITDNPPPPADGRPRTERLAPVVGEDRTFDDAAPRFETDTVQADRARMQGLGVGARELQAQRDPGGVRTADEED